MLKLIAILINFGLVLSIAKNKPNTEPNPIESTLNLKTLSSIKFVVIVIYNYKIFIFIFFSR